MSFIIFILWIAAVVELLCCYATTYTNAWIIFKPSYIPFSNKGQVRYPKNKNKGQVRLGYKARKQPADAYIFQAQAQPATTISWLNLSGTTISWLNLSYMQDGLSKTQRLAQQNAQPY